MRHAHTIILAAALALTASACDTDNNTAAKAEFRAGSLGAACLDDDGFGYFLPGAPDCGEDETVCLEGEYGDAGAFCCVLGDPGSGPCRYYPETPADGWACPDLAPHHACSP